MANSVSDQPNEQNDRQTYKRKEHRTDNRRLAQKRLTWLICKHSENFDRLRKPYSFERGGQHAPDHPATPYL